MYIYIYILYIYIYLYIISYILYIVLYSWSLRVGMGKNVFSSFSFHLCFSDFINNKKEPQRPYDHLYGGFASVALICVRKRRILFLPKQLLLDPTFGGGRRRRQRRNNFLKPPPPIPITPRDNISRSGTRPHSDIYIYIYTYIYIYIYSCIYNNNNNYKI